MNLRKVLKVSISTICLGLMITGLSVFAMDGQNIGVSEAERNITDLYFSRKNECMYIRYYYYCCLTNKDINNTIAIRQTEVFLEEFEKTKDFYYSDYYAELIVQFGSQELKARKQVEIYKQEILKHRNREYAKRYANLIILGLSEEKARDLAKQILIRK